MNMDFNPPSKVSDVAHEVPPVQEVARHYEVFPDGRSTLVIGDVERCKDFNHIQGNNELGYKGTCGLVACEDILRQHGVNVTENDLVNYAHDRNLCCIWGSPSDCGGTNFMTQAELLRDWGVPADYTCGCTLEGLAARIEEGRSIIAEVNAGILWGDARFFDYGQANHAIVVTGVARNPYGGIDGFFINDSGPGSSGRFVDAATMQNAFVISGGMIVSTSPNRINTGVTFPMVGGYYNSDGTYHWTSDNTDTDVETGKVVRRW